MFRNVLGVAVYNEQGKHSIRFQVVNGREWVWEPYVHPPNWGLLTGPGGFEHPALTMEEAVSYAMGWEALWEDLSADPLPTQGLFGSLCEERRRNGGA